MSNTAKLNICPKCHLPIPAGAPQGLCPKCVLLGAATGTEAGVPATATSEIPSLQRIAAAFPQLEVLELIGRGGMGFVFKARQPHLDRLVALKLLPDKLARDPMFAERFNREGRVLARLNHANIVSVYDFGQTGGFYYLLMEYVDGVNLRQAMKAGRFSPGEALSIVPKICEALQYAHDQGILHRDIKPENILLDAKGRVKIADFGIAKLVGEEQPSVTLTNTGAALGTPHYMAPEQLEKPSEVDHRADIYSLGVVFYEMLTGELPIGRFAAPSAKTPVGTGVDEVVFRTLEKDRERRFQSADEMKTQVEQVAVSPTSAAEPPPLREAPGAAGNDARGWSRWAFYGAVAVGLSLPAPMAVLISLLVGRGGVGIAELWLSLGSVALPGLGGTLLGWLGLNEIRESGGRVRGLPLALFATLTWPLVVLCGVVIGGPMFLLVPGGEPSALRTLGHFLVLLLPASVIAFSVWAVYTTARWAAAEPVARRSERRGLLKWIFIVVLVSGMGVVLVSQPGRSSRSNPRPQPIQGTTDVSETPGPRPIRANFRAGKGQVVTFEVVRMEGETNVPVTSFRGFAVAADDERGRFSVILEPGAPASGTNLRPWRLSITGEDGGVVTGGWADLGELNSMVPTNHLHPIEPESSFGLILTRAYETAETNGLTPRVELALNVRSQARGRVGPPLESGLVSVGSTNWVDALKQRKASRPTPQARPGEVLAYQWLKSPLGTNTTNRIRYLFTSVDLRTEDGQSWLGMDYDAHVSGPCEVVFRVDGNGFKAVTRTSASRFTPEGEGGAPVERRRVEWRIPTGVDPGVLESFCKSVREMLVGQSFIIPEGEQRPLFRLPIGNVGDLSVAVGTGMKPAGSTRAGPADGSKP